MRAACPEQTNTTKSRFKPCKSIIFKSLFWETTGTQVPGYELALERRFYNNIPSKNGAIQKPHSSQIEVLVVIAGGRNPMRLEKPRASNVGFHG